MRGIDTFKGLLYVITPVPQNTLENVDLFLQGYIQIPTCLLQVTYHPPLIYRPGKEYIFPANRLCAQISVSSLA